MSFSLSQGCRGIGGVFEVAEMERNMLISVTEAGKDKKVALMIMCDVV